MRPKRILINLPLTFFQNRCMLVDDDRRMMLFVGKRKWPPRSDNYRGRGPNPNQED